MLGILFFGAFVSFLNNSLLNVALPSIMIDLNIEKLTTVQWLSTGYMLVSGILIPISAFLLLKFTNRTLFITSMSIFTVGTIIAAVAPNFSLLLTGRMIQAAGSAVMSPLLMNIMLISFPREKRGRAMGVFGLVMITAPALGPPLSGYIVEYYDWRLLFEMIIPFAVISLLLAIWKLKNVMPTKKSAIDFPSVILSSVGFGSLLYGFSSVSNAGWSSITVYGTIILGVLSIVAFVMRQLKLDEPLLNLSVYKHPMFALSSLISVVNAAAMFSGMIITPAYMQSVRGISPMESGLMMLPGAIVMGIMSPITGRLFDKFGPKILSITGLSIVTITTYMLSYLQVDSSYVYIVSLYSIRMFGISMVMMPVMTNGLNQLPSKLNPHGTAVNNTVQQVAGAIGTAVFITLMNTRAESSAMTKLAALDPATITEQVTAQIKQLALLDGIQFTFVVSTATTVVALVLSFFMKRVDVSAKAIAKLEKEEVAMQ
ncbi:DHA2 family efflux MFS transporter permease subunit [Paenibacillus yanchengensis]|uniref:DHA2 family efflux MFS transporter permease subunit n=1 Tax=Paenibacillus yanchengensis TaxID=2035833 RepID=A0ABW4YMJ5_9BACL